MDIPKYKSVVGTQEQLLEQWKQFKDPEPVTETHVTPEGEKVTRVIHDVLHPDALNFWTKYTLPPIDVSYEGAISEHSPVLKSQPSPCCNLEYPVDNASEIGDILSH